jgi:hypothetical protein
MSLDCEVPEFYHCSEPTAAKAHKCCECRVPIDKGEKHLYCRMKFDGSFYHYRQHLLCARACEFIRDEFLDKFEDGCVPFGELLSEFREMRSFRNDKTEDRWKELRGMMAEILRRKRRADQCSGA